MNLFFFDVETTGLDKSFHEVIQIGAVLVVNNEIKEELFFNCKPRHLDHVDMKALEINKIKFEDLSTFEDPKDVLRKIDAALKRHAPVNQTWTIVGQNPIFDYNFFEVWWKANQTNNAKLFRNTFNAGVYDLITLAAAFKMAGIFDFPNFKLGTIIGALGIEFKGDAHNALTDIRATYEAFAYFVNMIGSLRAVSAKVPKN